MRLASFSTDDRASWGVIEDDGIHDLGARAEVGARTLGEALRSGSLRTRLTGSGGAPKLQLDSVTLLPPITDAAKILCVGLNYADHVREMNRPMPEHPVIFTRWNDTFVGSGGSLVAPTISGNFDYEGELAVVLAKSAHQVSPAEAAECILGYSLINDGSLRDFQRHTHQFTPGKNFPRSGGFGPSIVTADEIGSLQGLRITTRLNGDTVQSSMLDELIFSVPELISYCSQWTPLSPGDVIATGTPGGVGDSFDPPRWMRPGDTVEVEVDRIGLLTNTVVAEADVRGSTA